MIQMSNQDCKLAVEVIEQWTREPPPQDLQGFNYHRRVKQMLKRLKKKLQ